MNGQRTWAEISLSALDDNYHNIRKILDCNYLAVVKADAYGHGDTVVATRLQQLGADWFGVATADEGAALRHCGITRPILVFGYTSPVDASLLSAEHLTQALYSVEYGEQLQSNAKAAGVTVDCHLKLDTGMGRLGFDSQSPDLVEDIKRLCGDSLRLTGVFTHFAVADELDERSVDFTKTQLDRFKAAIACLEHAGIDPGLRHCANSAGATIYPESRMDMVRVGISQYGYAPSAELEGKIKLTPMMTFCSTIAMIKEIQPGDTLSYGRIYTAPTRRRIATIPVGYADGYPRQLGGTGRVIIKGKYAPVVGRVCMDQMMADITHIPEAGLGDRVILAGSQGDCKVSFEELAALTGTVNYERVCAVSSRVPRVYLD